MTNPATEAASVSGASPSPSAYGEAFADVYDDWYPADDRATAAAERLESLAGDGPALELGVGTGRNALRLAERGVPVWGVDASTDMLARLAAKDTAGTVTAVLGDMAELRLPPDAPAFSLVYATFNSFFLLVSEAAQRACLRRCREVLAEHGRIAFELYAPAPAAPGHDRWEDVAVAADGSSHVRSYRRSPLDDRVLVGRTGDRPWAIRPLPVDELDAMVADAGFELESRWRNWRAERYFARHGEHVSVWRRR